METDWELVLLKLSGLTVAALWLLLLGAAAIVAWQVWRVWRERPRRVEQPPLTGPFRAARCTCGDDLAADGWCHTCCTWRR